MKKRAGFILRSRRPASPAVLAALWVTVILFPGVFAVAKADTTLNFQPRDLSQSEIAALVASPPSSEKASAKYSPFPDTALTLPKAGETTPLRVAVSKGLEQAYDAYFNGRGEEALALLAHELKTTTDARTLWQLRFLKAQVLVMMGRAAAAEEELPEIADLEIASFGTSLNALALSGEIKVWLDDTEGARRDFARVVEAIGEWELPIQYLWFPKNRDYLYYATTAKLRAYTGIAGIYIFEERYEEALAWAAEAERLFNNAHFVTNHPLYGMNDRVYVDSYYGRAMNLIFLASAGLAVSRDEAQSNALYEKAAGFFSAINFSVGQVTIAAIKAQILTRLDMLEEALAAANQAMDLAKRASLPDYVWRIGTLAGVALFNGGRLAEAEDFLRQAQDAVDQVSGSLRTDRSRLRFGVGKSDIIYTLAQIDIENKRWDLLFSDLEKARARSFVDLLTDQALDKTREGTLVAEIRQLESQIISYRLIAMAPGDKDGKAAAALEHLMSEHQQKLAVLAERDPEVAELLSVRSITLSEAQSRLNPGEVIAYAIPGTNDTKIKFFLVTAESATVKELSTTYEEVGMLLERFSQAFNLGSATRGIRSFTASAGSSAAAAQNDILVDLKNLLGDDHWPVQTLLYVVPSSHLHFVPWSILETSYPIVSLPTGGWIARKPQSTPPGNAAVVVGDPQFGGAMPQLPGAQREAIAIADLYGATPLISGQASANALRRAVGAGARVLHLATHGVFDHQEPLNSAVFLSDGAMAEPLTAAHLFENPLAARLVVMSGCETGLGQALAGDDLIGLSRSFYLGGAVSILSSLWRIDDEGTVAYMQKFHEVARSGDFGSAWLAARDELKDRGYPASVYGAFVLGGAAGISD
ncbi:MAG: CHAT domain-containing tetratricopeptide repeat protein [Gammaproteobacteria bacterium]